MKKTKMEKGITLVALIITIVVLLILAAVAIAAIQNENILSHANNAAVKYNQAVQNEQDTLGGYLNYLDNLGGSATAGWTQSGTTVTNGTVTIKVGDYVNYVSGVSGYTDTKGWRVLGAENGEILLISTDILTDTLELRGIVGYNTGVSTLTGICDDYGAGTHATGARSIKVEDINRITGYNPETTGGGLNLVFGDFAKYGKTITYSLAESGYITWTDGADISGTSTDYTKFIHLDGRVIMSDTEWTALEDKTGLTRVSSIEVTNSAYVYNPETLTLEFIDAGLQPGVFAADNDVFKMLFGTNYAILEAESGTATANTGYTGEIPYWLGSAYEASGEGCASFGLFGVEGGLVFGIIDLCGSSSDEYGGALGVRPVVSLDSKIETVKNLRL